MERRRPDLTTHKRMEQIGELRNLLNRRDWLVEKLLKLSKLDAGTDIPLRGTGRHTHGFAESTVGCRL